MRKVMIISVLAVAVALSLLWTEEASADPQAPPNPPSVYAPNSVPNPKLVSGKEYSNNPDKTWAGVLNPLQNIAWDGTGNAWDTFDYSGSGGNYERPTESDQVDALANIRDAYYWDVVNDKVPLLTSFQADGNIYYQHAGKDTTGTWAPPPTINSKAPPEDVDGLEIWGPEVRPSDTGGPGSGDDANMFSLSGDPAVPGGGKVSVFYYNSGLHTSVPYISTAQIAGAIELDEQLTDLDAMMVFDQEGDDYFAPGDSIMFSIKAAGQYDGGEVWVWTRGTPAVFLTHGGEAWNTPHAVGADFRVGTEEINALEAVVPEPGTLLLLGSGLLSLIGYARKRFVV
ncbi:MAG: PEP-CTERM sorting domain-containing protein [Nitrospirae bacterium]|nr:PEP-CTERM sorting domain-containing protein [Nitrospirota bacterium]